VTPPLFALSVPLVGRVASCHRGAVERAVSWRADLRRACTWLKSIPTESSSLSEGPLFGDCLARVVVDRPDRAPARIADRSRRRFSTSSDTRPKGQPSPPPPLPAYEPNRFAAAAAWTRLPVCPHPSSKVVDKRRADSGSLLRWCRGNLPRLPETKARRPLVISIAASEPVPQIPRASSDWLLGLSERIRRRIGGDSTACRFESSETLVAPTIDRTLRRHPGSLSLGGQTVSEALLRNLHAEIPRADRGSSVPAGGPRKDEAPLGLSSPTAIGAGDARPAEIAEPPSKPVPTVAPAAVRLDTADAFSLPPLAVEGGRSPGRLRSHSALHTPAPAGVSELGESLGYGEAATEDVDGLAEKFRRILNDEARRFGLDV